MLKTPQRTARAAIERSAAICNVIPVSIRGFWPRIGHWTLTRSADGGFNGFARERSSELPCTRTKEELHASCSLCDRHRSRRARIAGAVVGRGRTTPRRHGGVHAPDAAPININTADVKELMKLEGVGRRVAEKIVEYRDTHGPFKKAEELRKVEGVGNGLWERNRTRIVIK